MAGIYLHIPFCRKACTYCDFHFSTQLGKTEAMVHAMGKELVLRQAFFPQGQALDSLYVGGGTPSLLSEGELGTLFEAVHHFFSFSPKAEVTLEANPEDLSRKKLQFLKSLGINRLSIGVQSFREEDLRWMNRSHSGKQAEASVKQAQDLGLSNLSIDLIYGLPAPMSQYWIDNLERALFFHVPHLSLYALTVEEKTLLAHQIKTGKVAAPEDQLQADQFLHAHAFYSHAGYDHYEISNFARPPHYAVHNASYWKGAAYLGIGPSAHGYDGRARYQNIANNYTYIQRVEGGDLPTQEEEVLDVQTQYHEQVMVQLRRKIGLNLTSVREKFGVDIPTRFPEVLKKWGDQGHLVLEPPYLRLSPKGWLLSDTIISDLFLPG